MKLVNTTQAGGTEKGSKPPMSETVAYSADDVLNLIVASLDDSKAEDVNTINIKGKSALGDYMVIASGRSHRHVGSMADHLLRALKEAGYGPIKVEGQQAADWILLDASDVIVHIFRPEVREFYAIEKMWSMPDQVDKH